MSAANSKTLTFTEANGVPFSWDPQKNLTPPLRLQNEGEIHSNLTTLLKELGLQLGDLNFNYRAAMAMNASHSGMVADTAIVEPIITVYAVPQPLE